jgi:hypothetical protein
MDGNIHTHMLGRGRQLFYDGFPFPPPPPPAADWDALFNRLPFPDVLKTPDVRARLAAAVATRRPYHLTGDMAPADVNTFLEAVNKAFPRHGDNKDARGPRTVARECAGRSRAALQTMFGGDAKLFASVTDAVQEVSTAVRGGLALVAAAPNLTFRKTHDAKDTQARLDAVDDPDSPEARQLAARMDASRIAHAAGTMDWHNVVVYFYRRKTFVYDPSAVRVNTTSAEGRDIAQRLAEGRHPPRGYDARSLVNLTPAAQLWAGGFHNGQRPRFGKTSNSDGAWLGGGGNLATWTEAAGWTGGDCRSMCGNFIVVVHALQWVSDKAGEADERQRAEDNLDWLLGGRLTGGGLRSMAPNVEWVRLRMH